MKTKQQLLKKTLFAPLLFISMCFFGQSFTSLPEKRNAAAGTIEFVKGDAVSLTFYVQLPEVPQKGCVLKISDQSGEVLFEKRITARYYSEIYKIERSNLSKLTFEATGKHFRVEESFNLKFIIEEKIEVTKL